MNRAYGYANIATQKTIDPASSLFRIGSISKTLTASVVCQLADRKLIDLDAPIKQYLPDIPDDKAQLTLRQLAGHLAGIRHYYGLEFLSNVSYTSIEEPMEVFIRDSLLFVPTTKYSYSTYGWTLISAIIEKATGKAFLALMDDELLTPAKLKNLRADIVDSLNYPRVSFYIEEGNKLVPGPVINQSNKWAGGGYLGTAEEVAKFGVIHSRPGFLTKSALETCTSSQHLADGTKTNYGIGFSSGIDDQSRYWYGHSGGSVGGTSMLLIYPEEELVVVTLVNKSAAKMDNLAWKIAKEIIDEQEL